MHHHFSSSRNTTLVHCYYSRHCLRVESSCLGNLHRPPAPQRELPLPRASHPPANPYCRRQKIPATLHNVVHYTFSPHNISLPVCRSPFPARLFHIERLTGFFPPLLFMLLKKLIRFVVSQAKYLSSNVQRRGRGMSDPCLE